MTPKQPDWKRQAKVDIMTLIDILRELDSIKDRIDSALVSGNEREYDIAIGDWTGEAE